MLDDFFLPLLAGAPAGLGVAMPLGAISALLLREGVVNGFKVAAAGGTGVALVDVLYCTAAAGAGSLIAPVVDEHQAEFLVLSGALIVAIGIHQLITSLRAGASAEATVRPSSPGRTFARFMVLTSVNPLTLVYFVALAGAIGAQFTSPWAPAAFVLGVAIASWTWQLLVAAVGASLGHSLGVRATRTIGIAASTVIVVLGVLVIASAV